MRQKTAGNAARLLLCAVLCLLFCVPADGQSENNKRVTPDGEFAWYYAAFGANADKKNNGYVGNANTGLLRLYSLHKKGKLVKDSNDGVAFYYTKINPEKTNFYLAATVEINSWTYTNGQEGFGLMAADTVGKNGNPQHFWNNSYMVALTKVDYKSDGQSIHMKLGVAAQEKRGVTPDILNGSGELANPDAFVNRLFPLDVSCAALGSGTYNLAARYTNDPAPEGTVAEPRASFDMSILKNSEGYTVSYIDPEGKTTAHRFDDLEALRQLDQKHIYVGLFAARNMDVTFRNVRMITFDAEKDTPPAAAIKPRYQVLSADIANGENHTLVYQGNFNGALTVSGADGETLFRGPAAAGESLRIPVSLGEGENIFFLTAEPDPERPAAEYTVLTEPGPFSIVHTVTRRTNPMPVVYVSPTAGADGDGTREKPMTIENAVRFPAPGQQIYLMEGVYTLEDRLVMEWGIDGTEGQPIRLWADPEAKTRPLLNCAGRDARVILAGSRWHLKGFDVTGTRSGVPGLLVSGSDNLIEDICAYRNGDTGIQISCYKSTDTREEWPSHNLVLNCTSYGNADSDYDDADGFAAKLTCGEGNVFDGCVAFYNSDDGFDLYAKYEFGAIGRVTIRNCVAYKNGYVLEDGKEIEAGDGNGFKLGGESFSGKPLLANSVAFGNRAYGIDSNSCPDARIENCTAYENGSRNVMLYTTLGLKTDFEVSGVLSFRRKKQISDYIRRPGSFRDL